MMGGVEAPRFEAALDGILSVALSTNELTTNNKPSKHFFRITIYLKLVRVAKLNKLYDKNNNSLKIRILNKYTYLILTICK